ncbi:MAG: hypothetical protein HYZ85_02515 [Candidatus Omnitrophica bacterium]|nr:hypothetical protein [Candidatus Omnitrophota bacterium]
MKLFSRFFQLCIFLMILAVIFRDFTCRLAFTLGLSMGLGTRVKIDSAHLDLKNTQLDLHGIEIKNPTDFGSGPLAKIPHLYFDWEISSLWEGRLHLETVEMEISEIHIMQLEKGKWNILELKPMHSTGASKGGRSKRTEESAKPLRFRIDRLVVSIDQATYSDLSSGVAKVKVIPLGIRNAQYQGIQSAGDMVKIVFWESSKRMGISGLSNTLGRIQKDLGIRGVESVQGFFEKTVAAMRDRL